MSFPASRRRRLLQFLALSPLFAACGNNTRLAALPAGSIVLAFGDSVTYGTGAGPGEDWPTLLSAATGWRVVNAGVPGDTADAGKARIRELLEAHKPALVIVEIGGNDFLRRRPAAVVKEDVRSIVRQSKVAGVQVVLVAVPELSLLGALTRRPDDAALYAEIGRDEQVPVIADVFSEILGKPELCADQIHPNAAGYRKMAEGIAAALRRFGLLR
ncbi:MAG: arylesterase [Rhodocyclaceae bacterium]|nr:arylesterase [Azospira sp.]